MIVSRTLIKKIIFVCFARGLDIFSSKITIFLLLLELNQIQKFVFIPGVELVYET
jgi:hypothetical protein